MIKKILLGFAGLVGLVLLYLLFWPVPIDPDSWTPPKMPELTGVYKPNNRLTEMKKLGEGAGIGPEAIAFDSQGRIYTGVKDGRILRFQSDGSQPSEFCNTKGRPLGLKFDSAGNLVIADALKGLISVAPDGTISVLTNSVNGMPIKFADDLAIASDGMIFFSDASRKFSYDDLMSDLLEHRPNGSLLAYNPKTRQTTVLLDDLYFANGIAISPDQSFVLINETWKYRVRRYWLSGTKKGQSEIFLDNLPGLPDNITYNGKGTFWIALVQGPDTRRTIDSLLPKPFIRKLILRLPEFLSPAATLVGFVIGVNMNAEVVHNLQDPTGKTFAEITSVIEHDNMLYFGSLSEDAIGLIPAP